MAMIMQKKLARNKISFSFQAPSDAERVSLAGDFNAWDQSKNQIRKTQTGSWETTIELAPGRYQYKFLVNGKTWFADPKAKTSMPDQFGGVNSVIEVR